MKTVRSFSLGLLQGQKRDTHLARLEARSLRLRHLVGHFVEEVARSKVGLGFFGFSGF